MTGCLYDNGQLIAEFDNETRVTSRYLHANGIAGDVGSLVYKEELDNDSVTRSNFFYNWRGDVIDVIDGSGAVTSYRYNAFGNIVQMSGTSANDIRFSSKRFDDNTGLSYFGARYYDSSTGRFISRDPMGYIDGPNQYIYCVNNPIGCIDPFGLCRHTKKNISINSMMGENLSTDMIRMMSGGFSGSDAQGYEYASLAVASGATSLVSEKLGNEIIENAVYDLMYKKVCKLRIKVNEGRKCLTSKFAG